MLCTAGATTQIVRSGIRSGLTGVNNSGIPEPKTIQSVAGHSTKSIQSPPSGEAKQRGGQGTPYYQSTLKAQAIGVRYVLIHTVVLEGSIIVVESSITITVYRPSTIDHRQSFIEYRSIHQSTQRVITITVNSIVLRV